MVVVPFYILFYTRKPLVQDGLGAFFVCLKRKLKYLTKVLDMDNIVLYTCINTSGKGFERMEERHELHRWRKIKGYSQEEFAEMVGVSVKTISRYENEGFKSASFPTVMKILKELNIKLDQLEIK